MDQPRNGHSTDRPQTKPAYGVDAPGVMLGLIGVGCAGLLVSAVGLLFITPVVPRFLFDGVGAVSLVPLGLGIAMLAYAIVGKLRLRDWMLHRIEWRGDETVLDIGAGRGLMAVGAAKRVLNGRVIAVDVWRAADLSGNGPEALLANAELEGVRDRIDIVTANARKLDLPDESVDVVFSVLCLHNIEPAADRETACREIARVLKPGGRALIGDYVGTSGYAAAFRRLGLEVDGPKNMCGTALGLMWVAEARKPGK